MRWICILAVLLAAVGAARAQSSGRRLGASESSASIKIGGKFTSQRVNPLIASQRGFATLSADRFTYTRGGARANLAALATAQLGLSRSLTPPSGSPLSSMRGRTGEVAAISGIASIRSLNAALPGWNGEAPSATSFLYTPQPQLSDFQRVFGLTPAVAEPESAPSAHLPPLLPRTNVSLADELERRTHDRVQRALRDALGHFSRGTLERRDEITGRYTTYADCPENLSRAERELRLVHELKRDDGLPAQLLLHIALEQDRPSIAFVYLLEAYHRQPDLFTATDPNQPFDRHFGDFADGRSAMLASQLAQYRVVGQHNPQSPEAQLLEAYCNWRLGNTPAAAHAAQAAVSLYADQPASDSIVERRTLAAALLLPQR